MKTIVLLCTAGMSTNLLVVKMREEARRERFDCSIKAYPLDRESEVVDQADIVLLGPQIRHHLKRLRAAHPDRVIEVIDPHMFGAIDGAGVLQFALEKMNA